MLTTLEKEKRKKNNCTKEKEKEKNNTVYRQNLYDDIAIEH
jgi:hypothetical protein